MEDAPAGGVWDLPVGLENTLALAYDSRLMRRTLVCVVALCVFSLAGQPLPEMWPGAKYDPAIPTQRKVLGHDPGERITSPANIVKYMEALAAASPKLKIFEMGQTWEGRKLIYAAVSSPANLAKMAEIKAAMQKLADPRKTSASEARQIMAALPAVIWLGYGVHGNEISSPDAALMTAYHLVAAQGDAMAQGILDKTVVLIDPLQNPDGRERFVHSFEVGLGLEPDPNSFAAEHSEPWPGGRTNHYFFDMNRDWFALTQPETRARVKALLEWFPLVFVDLHEMGGDSTYYFAPEADPFNPHLAKDLKDYLHLFGKNNAKWFDKFGFDYFTREVYDNFYPGYGASWPCYYGGIAMTYENASVRGLILRRYDDSLYTFRESVRKHFVASLSTAEASAVNREKLLEQFYRFRATAVEEGSKEPVREFILPRRGDTAAVDKLAAILVEQGIEVRRATAAFKNGGKEYPAGSYSIVLAQPAKRLIRNLLDEKVPLDDAFVKEMERRRKKNLSDENYDATAWALPLLYNVECVGAGEVSQGNFVPAKAEWVPPGRVNGRATVAYLVPWGNTASSRLLTAALRANLRILSSDKGFTLEGRKYPAGTLIFKVLDNSSDLHARLEKLAAASGAEVFAANNSYVEDGVNFGSRYTRVVPRPAIAMAWDTPTSGNAAGATRFVLERQFGYPVTPIRTQQLGGVDLSRFDVLILPDAFNYSQALGGPALQRVKDWVSAGGTLIGMAGAVAFLADPRSGLLSIRQENLAREGGAAGGTGGAGAQRRPEGQASAPAAGQPAGQPQDARVAGRILANPGDFERAIQPDTEQPDRFLGVIARIALDQDHWITAGAGEKATALVTGRAIYTPVKLDRGVNAATFLGPNELLLSGYLWDENRKQLAFKPMLVVERSGRGHVIAFTADPTHRAFMDGMNTLFLNAVFRGPAHSR